MKPYVPDSLPLDCLNVGKLIRRVGSANAAIVCFDGLLQSVANSSALLSPRTQREAVLVFSELVNQAEGRKVL